MLDLPSDKDKQQKAARSSTLITNTHKTMVINWNGFCRTIPTSRYPRLHLGRTMQIDVSSTPDTPTNNDELAPLFMSNVVQLHRLPETIINNHNPKFTSLFWTELHRLLGVKLVKSTAFHPQSNGASERMIRKASQVLRTLVRPDQLDWPKHLPTVEFALNSSVNKSTGFAPFELTYGYVPQTIQSVGTSKYAGVQEYTEAARDMVAHTHDAIIASCIEQTHHANTRCCLDEVNLETGQKAYLSMENLNLPKARAQKLMPKYIGPYEVLSCDKDKSYYMLALPDELLKHQIHPTFHAKLLRPAVPNDDACFPGREVMFFYNFGDDPEQEWDVDSIVNHKFTGNSIQFDVLWETGDGVKTKLSLLLPTLPVARRGYE